MTTTLTQGVEVILIVQKPLAEKTYVEQALANGKGITWLDDCRIPYQGETVWSAEGGVQWSPEREWKDTARRSGDQSGRFPANLLISDAVLDDGKLYGTGSWTNYSNGPVFYGGDKTTCTEWKKVSENLSGYSRFFSLDAWVERNLPFLIAPKASKREKEFGCENLVAQQVDKTRNDPEAAGCNHPRNRGGKVRNNHHPTVKPIQLMAYLITMGSREGDVVLDPFCGSGTTCLAAFLLKRRSFGIEIDPDYFEIASSRCRALVLESYRKKAEADGTPKASAGNLALPEPPARATAAGDLDSNGRSSITTKNDEGIEQKATTSLIISASRKTDIPAHHSEWFMERLRRGYLKVNFPASRYIAFDKTRLIVFWTKNPQPLLRHLDEIERMGIGYYFHFTLNDYEAEGLEPNVPLLQERIETFKALSDRIGKEKVIWRFDPLVLTDTIDKERLIEKVGSLMDVLAGYTEKIVFSFLKPSAHLKVERKLNKAGIAARDFSDDLRAYVAWHIAEMAEKHGMVAATCAEAVDLGDLGILRNKCIDDGLVRRLFGHDAELMAFINGGKGISDKGQRPLCGCIPSVDIGTYDTCRHHCLYCYANVSETAVENKVKRMDHTGELLVPGAKTEG